MKHIISILVCLLAATTSVAQTPISADEKGGNSGSVLVSRQSVQHVDSFLVVDMTLDLAPLVVKSSRSVELTPLLAGGEHRDTLPTLLVNGRSRHLLYQRLPAGKRNADYVVRRTGQKPQTVEYSARIPFRPWMELSELTLVTDLCGCGWRVLQQEQQPVAQLDFRKPEPMPEPPLEYLAPMAEVVKSRSLEGSAFLDFPVNRTEIHPDYRNNPRELAKIQASIDSVRSNRYATITAVGIKGYASPEGSYASNARLADGRAKALLSYIRQLYDFGSAELSVSSEPEDWAGLEKLVEASDLKEKEEILAIIRDPRMPNPDAREWKLKTLAGGVPYRHLLTVFYPALRHSDYTVRYTIRNFTLEEAKQLLYTDPRQLSLDEMYRVAQTYEAGSAEFNEVFEIAVRMYPDDPVSNLNAANTALHRKDLKAARHYLTKAAEGPQKWMAEEALKVLEEWMNTHEERK